MDAYVDVLRLEAWSRIVVYAKAGELDGPAADQVIVGVGGALDFAVERLTVRDTDGCNEALAAAEAAPSAKGV